ncbi:energy transducer TonB [Hymenobacter baengnokdamensis]|uniref:energy transducer TonB n=1 Tax=Hymenobacter baengnokdamensis TaxID=2615203 RepID=UPI0012459E32|nr:energy transducer TonB [Hymenobacter baengnokdamensis]
MAFYLHNFSIIRKCLFIPFILIAASPGHSQSRLAAEGTATLFHPPQMPGNDGDAAIVRAIQLGVKYSRQALRDEVQGQVLVSFAVSPGGQVCLIKIEQGIQADLDTAVVQAVRQLPRLQPATQNGKSVACLLRAPVTFTISDLLHSPRRPLPAADSIQLFTAVTRMPLYQGKVGYQHLAADIAAEYLRSNEGNAHSLPKFGAQIVVTVEPSGRLDRVERLPVDEAQKTALNALFGDQVAQREENEEEIYQLSEASLLQLAAIIRRLPRLTPAYVANQPVAMRLILKLRNPNSPY